MSNEPKLNPLQEELTVPDDTAETLRELHARVLNRRAIYETFARECGFELEFGGDRTCFKPPRTVNIALVEHLEWQRLGMDLLDFSVLHELMHLVDMVQDPKGFMAMLDLPKDARGMAVHRLYNCADDINANWSIAYRVPHYLDGREVSPEVKDYYRRALFPLRDLRGEPRCLQFATYLLHLGMGAAEDLAVSPGVRAVLDQGVSYFGRQYTFAELIDTFIKPLIGIDARTGWQGTAGQRKSVIDSTILPIFKKLMEEDIKDGREQELLDACSGPMGPGELSPDDLKSAVEAASRIAAEKNITPEEQAARERAAQVREIGKRAGLPEQDVEDFITRYQRQQDNILRLRGIWGRVRVETVEMEMKPQGHFATGDDLDMDRAIEEFPKLQSRPDEVKLMLRNVPRLQQRVQPREIALWLIIDISGSMTEDMPQVQDMAIGLAGSMAACNQQAAIRGEEVRHTLGIILFNDQAYTVLTPTKEVTISAIMESYGRMKAAGGTEDFGALQAVLDSLTAERRAAIARGDRLEMLIEIGDGENNVADVPRSQGLIHAIERGGVLCGAIRLRRGFERQDERGETNPQPGALPQFKPDDASMFRQIWNGDGVRRGLEVRGAHELGRALEHFLGHFIKPQ